MGAPVGMWGFQTGTRLPVTELRADDTDLSTPLPRTPWKVLTMFRNEGTTPLTVPKFLARKLAPEFAVPWFLSSRSRIDLMSSPVLIPTGHFTWHMPSAAQVLLPSYVKLSRNSSSLFCSACVRLGMACRREISR